jgi:hypothetical protein
MQFLNLFRSASKLLLRSRHERRKSDIQSACATGFFESLSVDSIALHEALYPNVIP